MIQAPTSKIGLASTLFGLLMLLVLTAPAASAQVTSLFVDAAAVPNGDGSLSRPFMRMTDALERARVIRKDSAAEIVVHVAPGVYVGSYTKAGPGIEPLPILVDVLRLKLVGATAMGKDEVGLPTGVIKPGSDTLLLAEPPLEGIQSLLVVGSTSEDIVVERITVANLTLNAGSGKGGRILRVDQVQKFTLLDNYVIGGRTDASIGMYVSRSSGQILGNYVTRSGCGMCIVAGTVSSPASVLVSGNRSVNNQEGGVLLSGSFDSPAGSLSVVVCGNDLSDNNSQPNSDNRNFFSFGLRVFAIFNTDDQASGAVTATVCNNRIRNNSAGVLMDAGFAYRTRNSTVDPRVYTGTLDLTFAGNNIVGNIRTPALISFTRFTASNTPAQLNPVGRPLSYKYLEGSIVDITDPGSELEGYWLDHPATDPVDGRTLKNVLRINGNEIVNRRYIPYSR